MEEERNPFSTFDQIMNRRYNQITKIEPSRFSFGVFIVHFQDASQANVTEEVADQLKTDGLWWKGVQDLNLKLTAV